MGSRARLKAANTFPVRSKFFFVAPGLDVSYNNITDEGVRHFADLLQVRSRCSRLKWTSGGVHLERNQLLNSFEFLLNRMTQL